MQEASKMTYQAYSKTIKESDPFAKVLTNKPFIGPVSVYCSECKQYDKIPKKIIKYLRRGYESYYNCECGGITHIKPKFNE